MSNTGFEYLQKIVKERRTVKSTAMNGQVIPREQMQQLLELADWAPTHGRTEPWYFIIYTGAALHAFGKTHGDIYWANTPEEKRLDTSREKLGENVEKASHLIVAVMKRGANPKIPVLEEIAATAAAVEHILLGAAALGIASFWSTGGMTHHPALKEALQLGAEDIILGLIYMGYTDEPAKEGKRNIPLSDKVRWE